MKLMLFFSLLLCFLFSGCSASSEKPERIEFFAMDTVITVTAYGGNRQALLSAEAVIEDLDRRFSVSHPESDVTVFHSAGQLPLSSPADILIARSLDLYAQTGGAFDITVGSLSRLWDFRSDCPSVPAPADLAAASSLVGSDLLRLENGILSATVPNMAIDLGAIAKGYAADAAARQLRQHGISSAVLSLGGNVRLLGSKPDGSPWTVAIADPFSPDRHLGTLSCRDTSVVTSGSYQRFFSDNGTIYHHILNPETGYPAESGLVSVTVVCGDGMTADGLSTALFVMGLDAAARFWQQNPELFDAVLVTRDGSVYATAGLSGTFSADRPVEVLFP